VLGFEFEVDCCCVVCGCGFVVDFLVFFVVELVEV